RAGERGTPPPRYISFFAGGSRWKAPGLSGDRWQATVGIRRWNRDHGAAYDLPGGRDAVHRGTRRMGWTRGAGQSSHRQRKDWARKTFVVLAGRVSNAARLRASGSTGSG